MTNKNLKVTITGFTSESQMKAFCDWYSGEGEQSSSIWLECHSDCEALHAQSVKDTGEGLEMVVEPVEKENSND